MKVIQTGMMATRRYKIHWATVRKITKVKVAVDIPILIIVSTVFWISWRKLLAIFSGQMSTGKS